MKRISALLAHPDEESFCSALYASYTRVLREYKTEHSLMDLYREDFDPVMDLSEMRRHIPFDKQTLQYMRTVRESRRLSLFFPDWWGAEPAILKGWLDRVLRQDLAYSRSAFPSASGGSDRDTKGLLGHVQLTVFVTSDTGEGDLDILEKTYRHRYGSIIGEYCGLGGCEIALYSPVRSSKLKVRKQWLDDAAERARLHVREK